ncbi:MAG: hypothetical protein ACXVCE_04650 [Bacteriovorax sp.]
MQDELRTKREILEIRSIELQSKEQAVFNRPKIISSVMEEINQSIEETPSLVRFFSSRSKFMNCLKDSLTNKDYVDLDLCKEENSYRPKDNEAELVKSWVEKLKTPIRELDANRRVAQDEVLKLNQDIRDLENDLDRSKSQRIYFQVEHDKMRINEIAENNSKEDINSFLKCDETSHSIDLEENVPYKDAKIKGPFFEVPRDNQDGIGSCFANTAKNLLVSLSDGKYKASFLDMSLQSKKYEREMFKGNIKTLSGGDTCRTLQAAQLNGFCPQDLSPAELGETHPLLKFTREDFRGIDGQAVLLSEFENFIRDGKINKDDLSQTFFEELSNPKQVIEDLKNKKDIKTYFPLVNQHIGRDWVLANIFSEGRRSKKNNYDIKYDDFFKEHERAYSHFFNEEINAILKGQNLDQIFDLYVEKMAPFLDKYDLRPHLAKFKQDFMVDAKEDFNSPTLISDLSNSIQFFNKNIKKQSDPSSKDCISCTYDQINSEIKRIENLVNFFSFLQKNGISSDQLFTGDNKVRSDSDLLQLAIAPACLNADVRVKPDFKIICDTGTDFIDKIKDSSKSPKEKTEEIRKRVVTFLHKGLALGNAFEKHINTIVGIRYNKGTNKCEYKIRESQDGTSSWQNEEEILLKIESLTSVYKE